GAGLPVGAFGGKREIMECIAPLGGVYQAGTLSGNPLAMRAGITMFKHLRQPAFYSTLNAQLAKLLQGLQDVAAEVGIALKTEQAGAMFGLYFTEQTSISSFDDILKCDVEAFKQFFHGMLERGIHFAPSAFEAGFISAAHSDEDIAYTIQAAKEVFQQMKQVK
ncbi:MAG: aminotransferase class III-fold pyridoxal phosphate-dependent enzyme, partial [Acinetobacter sp.]